MWITHDIHRRTDFCAIAYYILLIYFFFKCNNVQSEFQLKIQVSLVLIIIFFFSSIMTNMNKIKCEMAVVFDDMHCIIFDSKELSLKLMFLIQNLYELYIFLL